MRKNSLIALTALTVAAALITGCDSDVNNPNYANTARADVKNECPNYEVKPNPDIEFLVETYKNTVRQNEANGVHKHLGVSLSDLTTKDVIESLDYGVTCEQAREIRRELSGE